MLNLFKKQKKETVRFYFSCDDFPIYNFHKIMETSNHAYLVMGWNGYDAVEYNSDEALKRWGEIYTEYCKLTENNRALMYYKSMGRLMYLETRQEVCGNLLIQMTTRKMDEDIFLKYIKVIRSFDIPYEKDVKDTDCLEGVLNFLKASKNTVELLKDEVGKMVEKGEHVPFEKELVSVEQALGRNQIDPTATSVKKWVYMIQEIKRIVENQRQQRLKTAS